MTSRNNEIARCLVKLSEIFKCSFSVTLINDLIIENNSWVIIPTDRYIEFSNTGPITFNQIKWVDIDPITLETIGKMISPKITDSSEQIINEITKSNLLYSFNDNKIRLAFQDY